MGLVEDPGLAGSWETQLEGPRGHGAGSSRTEAVR